MNDIGSFGAWLRQQRRLHDLSQVELAQRIGCAVGTLRNIETDSARPSKQLAARFGRYFGVSDAELPTLVAFARGSATQAAGSNVVVTIPTPAVPVVPTTALPSVSGYSAQVPAQLTELIGRTELVASLRQLLVRRDVRLVTLTGPGGTGKTRVAVHVVSQLMDNFTVYFVDLSAISDPSLLLATIAQTIGVAEGSESLEQRLAAVFQDQPALLLLDSFECLVIAAPTIVELLANSPQLKVLATSRSALGVMGEYEWPVPPLSLPDRMRLPPIEQLSQYEAIRMFTERACAANPRFAMTPVNAPAIAEICHQLDGLPLAIELVAAWVKLFEPQALLGRLDQRLSFLTGGRDRPTRQQTMWNTIEWSYRLLSPNEQQLFQRLSVFAGGATLSAIESVCGETTSDVVQGVSALLSQSLLRTLPPAPESLVTEPRVGMLETIREYAQQLFETSPDVDDIHRRHARYFAALAAHAAEQWYTPALDSWLERLNLERDNLRTALQYARTHGDSSLGLQLAGALWKFWQGYGYTSEGRLWLGRLLTLDDPQPDVPTMVARLCGLQAATWLATEQRDDKQATKLLEQSILLRRTLRETTGETNPLVNAARQARTEGHYSQALSTLSKALHRHDTLRERLRQGDVDLGLSLYDLGLVLRVTASLRREQGNFAEASELLEESLWMHRKFGEREGAALMLLGLADIRRDQGNAAHVRLYGEECLVVFRELNIGWAINFTLNTLAFAAVLEGDLSRAWALISECVMRFRELNAYSSLAEVLNTQGFVLRAQGDLIGAYESYSEALRLAWAVGPRLFVAVALDGLASVAMLNGQAYQAVELLAGSAALRAQMGTPIRPIDRPAVDQALAHARAALGVDFEGIWAAATTLPLEQIFTRASNMLLSNQTV